ncbi:MAG: sugar phosphate isomerase/epimerase family protein [Paracoccaceae bacterium]
MTRPNRPRYAARLNAFKPLGGDARDWIAQAGRVPGIDAADLNYPDHFAHDPGPALAAAGLHLNGLAMRYYSQPGYRLGAFTNPDPAMRRQAIDDTKRGIDAGLRLGSRLMTLWMGQDGFDYAFQLDYARAWDDTVAAIAEVCDHAPEVDVAIEYKPDEPRAFALLGDVGHTLLACREVGRPNLGVTLDFAHVLYAGEMPAHSAMLVARHSRLLGLHLNDGYAKRDDGLMAGTVHPVATVELLVEMLRQGHDGVIYFDTFPDAGGADPVAEAAANVALTDRLREVAEGLLHDEGLKAATARQDAAASQRIVARALFGA